MKYFWAILFLLVPVAGIVLFIASVMGWQPVANTWLPESMSLQAENIDHLYVIIHIVAAITLALTGVTLFIALFTSTSKGVAKYTHGNKLLEIAWTVIPGAILVWLAFYQSGTWTENKITPPENRTPVAKVVARQYDWEFFYPGDDGVFDTADDLRSVNRLVVPKQKHVVLHLQSEDVIHSFFVPKLRLKQDIVPDNDVRVWFSPTAIGKLEIVCAELCGWGHFNMRARMEIVEPADFQVFLDELKAGKE